MRKNSRKGPSYLDVAEFILTGPFSPKITTLPFPVESEPQEVPHFNNLLACPSPTMRTCKSPFTHPSNLSCKTSPLSAVRSTSRSREASPRHT